jgi:hypothetical protein
MSAPYGVVEVRRLLRSSFAMPVTLDLMSPSPVIAESLRSVDDTVIDVKIDDDVDVDDSTLLSDDALAVVVDWLPSPFAPRSSFEDVATVVPPATKDREVDRYRDRDVSSKPSSHRSRDSSSSGVKEQEMSTRVGTGAQRAPDPVPVPRAPPALFTSVSVPVPVNATVATTGVAALAQLAEEVAGAKWEALATMTGEWGDVASLQHVAGERARLLLAERYLDLLRDAVQVAKTKTRRRTDILRCVACLPSARV